MDANQATDAIRVLMNRYNHTLLTNREFVDAVYAIMADVTHVTPAPVDSEPSRP